MFSVSFAFIFTLKICHSVCEKNNALAPITIDIERVKHVYLRLPEGGCDKMIAELKAKIPELKERLEKLGRFL